MHIWDLTQPLSPSMPHWPGDPETRFERATDYSTHAYRLHRLCLGEHSGTHFGAARHFLQGGRSTADYPAEELILEAAVLHVETVCRTDPDHLVTLDEIRRLEESSGSLAAGSLLLVSTGWAAFWTQPERYLGSGRMRFPGVSIEAAQYLVDVRRIRGLGIDTAGVDGGLSMRYPVNRLLCEKELFHLENVARLDALPDRGVTVFIGVLPISGGCGSPCRVIAVSQDF